MYYPGHVANSGVRHGAPMNQQQQQQGPTYLAAGNQGTINPYGYYQQQPMQHPVQQPVHPMAHQQSYFNQGLVPPPIQHHPHACHRHTCSFPQATLPPMGMFYGVPPAPILPPLAIEEPVAREESVNGGVNQFLDYDLDLISDFVVKNAYIAFGTDASTIIRETNSTENIDLFTKGVSSVLNATRLPSVTIFLAIDLLHKYISKLPQGIESLGGKSVNVIYQNTMIALVLANKFNDDKTFTNKSWTQATGMTLNSVNDYEKEWLEVLEWRLFQDKFTSYEKLSHSFELFCQDKRCPSPPNLLPTPHSTDNYLSPLSGYQTPAQLKANIYSSPCYYNEDPNDCLHSNRSRIGVMNSSPINRIQTSQSVGVFGMNGSTNYNPSYFQYGMQQPNVESINMGVSPNRSWTVDENFHNPSKLAQMDSSYYCYSAVY